MILYTVVPPEHIYPTDSNEYQKQLMIHYDGIPLLVEQMDEQHFQVIRVMSTDPNHFMDDRCMPGSKISTFM